MVTPQTVHGTDVSHHQGKLDFVKAKSAGLDFVYHKATEGTTVVDPEYAARRKQAKSAGLPFGAYHFARPSSQADAVLEARFFVKVANPLPGDLVPVLDLEVAAPQGVNLERWAKDFMAEVKRLTGATPMHYGPDDFGTDYPYLRWVPRYNNQNTPPRQKWDIWQFSNGVYGVPKSFPGLGNVDLNTMRPGLKVSDFTIPKKVNVPVSDTVDLKLWHASLQFNDTPAQRESDIKKIFETAKSQGVDQLTGTEGAEKHQRDLLRKYAELNGFTFWCPAGQDSWISIRKDRIASGYHTYYSGKVVDGIAKKWSNKGTVAVDYVDKEVGPRCVIANHLLTKGTPASTDPERRVNIELNKKLMADVYRYAKIMHEKGFRVTYSGDQNIEDKRADTALGYPFTSCWDALKYYPGTGHGTIDVICLLDASAGCKFKSARSFNDTAFHLHTDHFLIQAIVTFTKKVPAPAPALPTVDLSQLVKAAKTDPGAKQGNQTYPSGVKIVEAALAKEGLLSAKYAGDGSFGTTTVDAYKKWQRRLGYTGADADGIPGMKSLSALGQKYKFKVVS